MRTATIPSRGRFCLGLRLLIALIATSAAQANERVLTGENYPKLEKLCHDFHDVMPPPPPVEAVLIGTFDYATGGFVWGPKVYEKKTENDNLLIDLSQPWKDMKIRAIRPNLDPKFTTLTSAWGQNVTVTNMINQAIHINVGSAGGPSGVVGSGATGSGDTASPPAPAPRPRGRTPAGAGNSARTAPPKTGSANTGGGNLANVNVTDTIARKQLVGHSTKWRKFYAPVRSGCVDIIFRVINRPPDAQVTISSEGRSASANSDQIDLVVPARVWVPFSLKCGDKNFDDLIILARPPILGCFTLEAMPLAIIYEPPGSNSSQKLITTKSIGTTLETFTSTDSSDTEPVTTDFSTVTEAIGLIGTIGEGVEKAYPQVGAAIKAGGEVISAAWGSSETDKEVSNTVTDSRKLSMQLTTEDWGSTSTHTGPGHGDVFHYLIKPTFLWLAVSDEKTGSVYITVSLLGYKGVGRMSADLLRSGANPIPPKDMQLAMLKLDPMADEYAGGSVGSVIIPDVLKGLKVGAGVPGALSRRRLVFSGFYSFGGSNSGTSIERKIEEEDTHTRVTTETVTTTESAGFLSYVAKNVPQDGEKKMTLVQGTSNGAQASDTVKVEVQYGTGENATEFHNLNVYYDTLFGTFAFEEAQVSEVQQMSGQAMTAEGEPASKQRIALIGPDGTTTIASTDEKGNFRIGSPTLAEGNYKLKIGDKEIPFEFPGIAVEGMKVDVSRGTADLSATAQAASSGRKTKVGRGGLSGAEGAASQPTVKETADTAMAQRGKPAHDAGFTVAPNPALKGRLGRIVVKFPKDAPCKDSHVSITRAGQTESAGSFYGSDEAELLPGAYTVKIADKTIKDVTVASKSDTLISTGVLRVHASKNTHIVVLDTDKKTEITSGYGDHDFGLPVGLYHIRIAGQVEPVEVKKDEVTEF